MSTRSLAYWIALVGGAEIAWQGHLADDARLFHAGAWLLALMLATSARRLGGLRGAALGVAALVPVLLSLLAWLGLPARETNPLEAFWRDRGVDRRVLTTRVQRGPLRLFDHEIALDHRGFRADVSAGSSAPGSFRIVALGGSTTFGATQGPEERPWPSLLQERIDGLGCRTPIEVVNAGRPGRALGGNVKDFERELRPLAADLIVFYPAPQDVAGFMHEVRADVMPTAAVPARASTLLRRLERAWRSRGVTRRYQQALQTDPADLDLTSLSLTPTYRRLLVDMRRRGIDVALATASLAVNGGSSEAEIRLHEAIETRTRRLVLANRLHGRFLRAVAGSYRALLVDTRPGLDGAGEALFLDLFHLNESGRARLADNVLEGLMPRLTRPDLGCTPPAADV